MNSVLLIITTVVLLVSAVLFLGIFLGTLQNYRALRKRIQYDQARSEKGEAVLLKDSFLYQLFYYADKDFSLAAPPADPLGIYSPLLGAKWIFTLSQVILIITLVGIGIALFMSLTGSEAEANSEGAFKQFMRMAFPMIMSVVLSIMMILYVATIYKKLYTNQIWPQIQANQVKLNALHSLILGSLAASGDTEFYTKLNSENVSQDTLHASLTTGANEAAIVRRLTTLSLRDYFMSEVPSYTTSPIRNLFTADSTKQTQNPGLYIRIDCSRTVQNYAYKHDKLLNSLPDVSARARILADVSSKLNDINKQISVVRLESMPMITLIENFFRISTYYFFFMVVIVIAILVGWYNLGCKFKRVWLSVKYSILKLSVKVLPAKKDAEGKPIPNYKETRLKELEAEYDKQWGALECTKKPDTSGGSGTDGVGM